ncbi:uncharacterized protein MEPE_06236 [Melanopsichium pennsylvanicum]|uniref:Polynucleotide 5'-hydroxyl-kinase GRC3 n=2 Tax=Melanopsichium pennsylvanicum TaxID=63383 RepID=A0AAJ5C823_9BASI|nr:conserved hypothetical protein [Melanopsichium pennsylvanicum 4]SNX87526.1 uncharacterized protein MEPE_06236 [Melanopsichium pennsylvanicum]
MAPRKKLAATASAPISALAARKAKQQQAEAQRYKTKGATVSTHDGAVSSPRTVRRASARHTVKSNDNYEEDSPEASVLEVILPLPTASPAVASPSAAKLAFKSFSRNRGRPSVTLSPECIAAAASWPRRGSVTAQSTPVRSIATKAASSSTSTPASSSKKRKTTRETANDSDIDIQDILDELEGEEAASDVDASEPEQPPRKKRASQPAKARSTPAKSRRSTAAETESSAKPKRTSAKRTPTKARAPASTPSKTARSASNKEAASEKPKRTKAAPNNPLAKVNESVAAKKKKALTEDEKRLEAVKRYFAGPSRQHEKIHAGPSAMPIEDKVTGFLRFGEDDSDPEEAIDATQIHEETPAQKDGDNSSEDEGEQEIPSELTDESRRAVDLAVGRPPTDLKGKGRQVETPLMPRIVLDSDDGETDDGQSIATVLSREALLDAIPYSNFTPVLSGDSKNMHVVDYKRKRAREATYFGLRHGETLTFLGIGRIQVLQGCAQVGGAFLFSSSEAFKAADIYAPISNALPVLKSISDLQFSGQERAANKDHDARHGDDNDIAMSFGAFDTVVKVTPLSSPVIALGQVCPIGGLSTPFSMPPNLEVADIHQLSTVKILIAPDVEALARKPGKILANGMFSTAGLSATYIPHKWQMQLDRLATAARAAAMHPQEESIVALVRGTKKVGKSTFSRMALERLLSVGTYKGGKVAYLELDVGQSDFGPPGMVALHIFSPRDKVRPNAQTNKDGEDEAIEQANIDQVSSGNETDSKDDALSQDDGIITLGPGWCQHRVPARAHFIGDSSPKDDPESYVAAIYDLMVHFRHHIQPGSETSSNGIGKERVPLVINTMGWIKGLGAELAARLEPILRPTHIIDVVPRGGGEQVAGIIRGAPWLDEEGRILAAGPEIVTLESVSSVEFGQGFGATATSLAQHAPSLYGSLQETEEKARLGDGGSNPPRYITDVGSKMGPAEARLLNTMSYLYATSLAPSSSANGHKVQGTWDFTEPLVHRKPCILDVADVLKGGISVLAQGSSVPDSYKLMAIDSSIVAIVVADPVEPTINDDWSIAESKEVKWKRVFNAGRQLLVHRTSCVGLGIVRAIDPDNLKLHLLTPIDPAILVGKQHVGLVKGGLELPVWASLDFEAIKEARESRLHVPPLDALESLENGGGMAGFLAGVPRNQVPYLGWPNYGPVHLGLEKKKVRRNLMRKSQFT